MHHLLLHQPPLCIMLPSFLPTPVGATTGWRNCWIVPNSITVLKTHHTLVLSLSWCQFQLYLNFNTFLFNVKMVVGVTDCKIFYTLYFTQVYVIKKLRQWGCKYKVFIFNYFSHNHNHNPLSWKERKNFVMMRKKTEKCQKWKALNI